MLVGRRRAGGGVRPRHDPGRLAAGDPGDAAGPRGRDRRARRHRGDARRPPAAQPRPRVRRPVPDRARHAVVRPLPRALRGPRRAGHPPPPRRARGGRLGARARRPRRRRDREVRAQRPPVPRTGRARGRRGVRLALRRRQGRDAKGETLRDEGAVVYVGDTPNDVRAAALADAHMVAVTTGPHPADELRAAGATTVLDSLVAFPDWLHHHLE